MRATHSRKHKTWNNISGPHIAIDSRRLVYDVTLDHLLRCKEAHGEDENSWLTHVLAECDLALIHVNTFGANRLYKLVDIEKLREYYNYVSQYINIEDGRSLEETDHYYTDKDNPTHVLTFFWGLMDEDVSPAQGVNLKTSLLNYNKILTPSQALEFFTQYGIAHGLNKFYEKNDIPTRTHFGFSKYHFTDDGSPVYDEYGPVSDKADERAYFLYERAEASEILSGEIPFFSVIPDFAPDGFTPGKYKYLVDIPGSSIKFSNNILSSHFNHIFMYIPEFDLWQELHRDEVEALHALSTGKIKYSRVDDPHCFSTISYSTEFNIDSLESTLFTALGIAADINWHSMFCWQRTDTSDRAIYKTDQTTKTQRYYYGMTNDYEALTFDFNCHQYNVNVTLTQEELGIGNNAFIRTRDTGVRGVINGRSYRNHDFWLLGLIIQILKLRPTMGDLFTEGDFDAD